MSRNLCTVLVAAALLLSFQQAVRADATVGQPAPQFTATDTKGTTYDLSALTKQGKIVVLEWFNPQCPYDQRHYNNGAMNDVVKQFADKDVVWLAVSSTHNLSAADITKSAEQWHITHPILMDQAGALGHLYGAKTTPHMFIINKDGVLAYCGAIDNDQRGNKGKDAVNYVAKALNELLAGQPVTTAETRPYGCSVKYGKPQAAAPATSDNAAMACGGSDSTTEKPKDKDKDKAVSVAPPAGPAIACDCGGGTTEKPKEKDKDKPAA